jgi:serine/threonine protein kinase/Tfp pilus assembly protein PilF
MMEAYGRSGLAFGHHGGLKVCLTGSGPMKTQGLASVAPGRNATSVLGRQPSRGAAPVDGRSRSRAIDDAYEEYCALLEAGELPDPEEFCERYPAIKTSLLRCVGLHHEIVESPEAVPAKPAIRWPRSGDRFLQLILVRELGRGAFSRVFLAEEPALGNRRVAVKIAHRGGREAQTLGRLDHPNIVPIYSVEEDPVTGLTAVCMPYQGRATLCDVMDAAFARIATPTRAGVILEAVSEGAGANAGGPAPWIARTYLRGSYGDGVAHIALQLADALQLIHARGVYHLDLKLSNVLMTPQGKPMLLDFNLSRDNRLEGSHLGGTLLYMSPEQLRASAGKALEAWDAVDGRSDLYSLGVILYELASGHHPSGRIPVKLSEAETRARLLERQHEGPIPLTRTNPRVDRELARIIERCLANDPAARFSSAEELAEALRRRSARQRRNGRLRNILIASCMAIALIVAGGGLAAREAAERGRLSREAAVAYKDGQYQQAVQTLNRLLKADPINARAFYGRGRAHQRLGNMAAALADFQKADNLAPDGQTKACIAFCEARLMHFSEAIIKNTEAIKAGYAPATVSNNLGFCYLVNGQLKPAQPFLNAAIESDPKLQAAFYNRALADLRKALNASANRPYFPRRGLADIETAIKLGPPSPEVFRLAGFLHAVASETKDKHKNIALAVENLRRAVENGLDIHWWKDDASLVVLKKDPRFLELTRLKPLAAKGLQEDFGLLDPVVDPAD